MGCTACFSALLWSHLPETYVVSLEKRWTEQDVLVPQERLAFPLHIREQTLSHLVELRFVARGHAVPDLRSPPVQVVHTEQVLVFEVPREKGLRGTKESCLCANQTQKTLFSCSSNSGPHKRGELHLVPVFRHICCTVPLLFDALTSP